MTHLPRTLCAILAFASCAALPLETAGAAGPAQRFSAEDVFRLEWAASPQISPDARAIVYERQFMDVKSDTRRANLWIVDTAGKDHRPLTTGSTNDSTVRWSPDATRIAYASADTDGSRQLYVRWLDTGATLRVAQLTSAPGKLAWSPDGGQIAFTMAVPARDKSLDVKLPEPPEGADWAKPPRVVDRVVYRADGRGFLPDAWMQVFVVPATGGSPRQLTEGTIDHGGLAWMPDGRSLLVSANRHDERDLEPLNTEIYSIPLDGGEITALTSRYGPDLEPVPSPDGKLIAFTGFDDRHQGYQITRLYVMDRDGSNVRVLTGEFDRDVGNPHWMRNGRGIVVAYADHGVGHLALVSLDGKRRELAGGGSGADIGRPYEGFDYSVAGNGTIAFTSDDPTRPADVAVVDGNGKTRLVTNLNDDLLPYRQIGTVTELEFPSSADGRSIEGWVILPPGFEESKQYPLVLEIHGGPFAAYGPHFSAELQLYAARGYVVVYTNPRGSTSYGEEFGNLIHHAYPSQDYDDLMSAVDAVIKRGYVDPDRLYVTGGSGGGVLTAWIVGRTDRFRAAVSVKPVINWTSFALTSDNPNFFYKYWFSGFPWEQHEEYWKRSPLSQVGNVKTPTMLMTGEEDHRTPISEAEQFYEALRLRQIDTLLVRVPGASHLIASRPSQLVMKSLYILAWFAKYGGPPDAAAK